MRVLTLPSRNVLLLSEQQIDGEGYLAVSFDNSCVSLCTATDSGLRR
jgi:hypothetical protein